MKDLPLPFGLLVSGGAAGSSAAVVAGVKQQWTKVGSKRPLDEDKTRQDNTFLFLVCQKMTVIGRDQKDKE